MICVSVNLEVLPYVERKLSTSIISGLFPKSYMPPTNEPEILMENLDTDNEKLGVMLGVWKPLTNRVSHNFYEKLKLEKLSNI